MQFSHEIICDAVYSCMESPLKQIDAEFQRLEMIPVNMSLLPGIFIDVKKITPGSVGIGNFLGYDMDPDGKITGEICGRRYDVNVNAEIWLDYQDKTAALQTMQAVNEQLNGLFPDHAAPPIEDGILNISLRKSGEIESNAKNDLLPQNMQKTIRKIFRLSLICEFSETRTYETIKKVITTSDLA